MPAMDAPRRMRNAIICFQVWMNPVHRVIEPKQQVINENQRRGPNVLTAIVDGSWKQMLAIVKMKMETEYRLPLSRSRSDNMEVTEALEMTPLSSKLRLHKIPAIVQRRKSTFSLICFSRIACSSLGFSELASAFWLTSASSVSEATLGLDISVSGADGGAESKVP